MIPWLPSLLACTPAPPAVTAPAPSTIPETPTTPEVPGTESIGLVLNEVMAKNDSSWQLDDGALPDWFELYNGGAQPLELARVTVSDSSGEVWYGPSEVLPPGEAWIVAADDGISGAPFKISSDGDRLELFVDGALIDAVSTPGLGGDVAWARHPDGGAWAASTEATPGTANPAQPSQTLDPSDVFFTPYAVSRIELEVAPELLDALNSRDGTEVDATLTYEGIRLEVAVKLKGGGSFQGLAGRPAFKIDINERVPGQRLRGLKALTLNNGVHDPTFSREFLTYKLFNEAGLVAPRVGWAHVFLNGEDYGLRVGVETLDDLFLERRYDDPSGLLMEADRDDDLARTYDLFQIDEGTYDEDFFVSLAAVLADPGAPDALDALAQHVDLDRFVRYVALEALTMHWDGYQRPKNYHLYLDPGSGLLQWLPHGTDWTWKEEGSVYYGRGDVFRFCLAIPECKDRFHDEVHAVSALHRDLDLAAEFLALDAWLRPVLEGTARFDPVEEQRELHHTITLEHLQTRPDRIEAEVEAAP